MIDHRPPLRLVALIMAAALSAGGCFVDRTQTPSPSTTAGPTGATPPPSSSAAAFGGPSGSAAGPSEAVPPTILTGPWLATPPVLDAAHVAIVSDACAAEARTALGETEANLPTVLVDARGEGLLTAIFADDLNAVECLARIDDAGSVAVDSVDRLSRTMLNPVQAGTMTVDQLLATDDREGGRLLALGRMDADVASVAATLERGGAVSATTGGGWWTAWWPAPERPTGITAVDTTGATRATATIPARDVEARTGPAAWWLDPQAPAPTADSTTVAGVILEEACASGHSPEGRVDPPAIELTDTSVIVTFAVRKRPGPQDCQGGEPFRVTIELPEPLGKRALLDGSETPPREAAKPPVG